MALTGDLFDAHPLRADLRDSGLRMAHLELW